MTDKLAADVKERLKNNAANDLPLVSREWKNGSNSSYNSTPFLHSLLTKGKMIPLKGASSPLGIEVRTTL